MVKVFGANMLSFAKLKVRGNRSAQRIKNGLRGWPWEISQAIKDFAASVKKLGFSPLSQRSEYIRHLCWMTTLYLGS